MHPKKRGLILLSLLLVLTMVSMPVEGYNKHRWRHRRKDTTPPEVTITNPIQDEIVSGVVTISYTAVDNFRWIKGYEIYIDGELRISLRGWRALFRWKAPSYEWNTSLETEGIHTITCRARDLRGNWGDDTISVMIDNDPNNFKLMSYNIEAGGIGDDWKQVIVEENPDILVVIETGTWDDHGDYKLEQTLNELNSQFLNEVPYYGFTNQDVYYSTSGAAILSRYEVLDFRQIGIVPLDDGTDYDVTHDFFDAVLNVEGTAIHIIGSHLKASSGDTNEWRRERETEGIINYMDSLGKNVPIMYMGDLNSFSPADTGDLAPEGDLGYGPLTMMLYPDNLTYSQYASENHTFTDVYRLLNPLDPGYTFGHQNPIYTSRIDFILVNSFFEGLSMNSTVGDTSTADIGSDHYSVDAFINWDSSFVPDVAAPTQITGLNATTINMAGISLEWNDNTNSDFSHYRVYRDGKALTQLYIPFLDDIGLFPETTYTYEVTAIDTSGNEGLKSISASATTNPGGTGENILVNEILPDPNTLYNEEWIELYNPQDLEADLSGFILDDITTGGTLPYTIPAGTVVPANGFYLFYQGMTGIALNNAGDTVNYLYPNGTILDTFTYSSSSDDISYGRQWDGSEIWITFSLPTPGESNGEPIIAADSVVLNEFLPDPNTLYSEEWIELFNPLDFDADISGYVLDDITSGGTASYTIPSNTIVPAQDFYVFYQGITGIGLNNAGDTANFIHSDGVTILDSFTYGSSSDDVSFGRETDGGIPWVTFDEPTPGLSNGFSASLADSVLLNEFLPDPNTLYSEEWIELYNPLTENVDISSYILDDLIGGGTAPYLIPGGTIVPAKGFITFYQSVTNIGLNNAGDTVNYIHSDGITVLDSFGYGSSSDDVSYGREIDGGVTWITFDEPTPGTSNNELSNNANSILLNEFLPDPNTLYSEEWIELYNPLDFDADISGYILDDLIGGGTAPYLIPGETIVPANGFIVFYQGITNIGLNNAGDTLNYIHSDGITVLDSFGYGSSSDDVSYGREIDGGITWITFDEPTPGLTNGIPVTLADSIVLNEFLPDPYILYTEEWIELYNPNDVDVDISGYVLDDIIGGGTAPYIIPSNTIIPAHGYLLFLQSTTNIALNNAGDTVNYIGLDGATVLDSYTYSSSNNDVSYGRETDGGDTWITFTVPTPGTVNDGSSTVSLSVNIVESWRNKIKLKNVNF